MNNKLDDFFKDKFEGEIPEFQDKYWEQAERILDEDRRRRRPIWWWLSAVALLISGAAFWWWNTSPDMTSFAENTIPEIESVETIDASHHADNQLIEEDLQSDTKIISENNIGNKNEVIGAGKAIENKVQNVEKAIVNNAETAKRNSTTNSVKRTTERSANALDKNLNQTKNKAANKAANKAINTPIFNQNKTTEKTPSKVENALNNKADESLMDKPIATTVLEENTTENKSREVFFATEKLPLLLTDLESELVFPFEVNVTEKEDTKTAEKPQIGLLTEVGLFPFQEKLAQYPSDIYMGGFMNYNLGGRWTMEGRMSYHLRRALEEEVLVTRNLRYNFGLIEEEQKYIKQQEHLLELGLNIRYQLTKKQQIALGGGTDLLVLQYGEIRTNTSSFPWEVANEEQLEKGIIALNDTPRNYPFLEASYDFQLNNHWGIYARAKHFPFQKGVETFNNKFRVNLGLKYTF